MEDNYNKLTPAETERLAKVLEECGEIQQVIGKILQHGFESFHPDEPEITNRILLQRELGDLSFWINVLMDKEDINGLEMMSHMHKTKERKAKYLRHNTIEDTIEE